MHAVCASSKHPAQAIKVIELLHTDPEVANLMAYGIEGKHYVWVDKARYLIGLPEGKTWADTGYFTNLIWMFGNLFLSYYNDPWQVDHKSWDEFNQFLGRVMYGYAARGKKPDR
jgi:putative aldouronate transport system substrate-binding protein